MATTKKKRRTPTTMGNDPFESFRRIVVALDESRESQAALEAAAQIASALGRELLGVFVEDENLLKLAQLPLASEFQWGSASRSAVTAEMMQAALRVQAERARQRFLSAAHQARIDSTFQVSRGRVSDELRSRSETSDLLILGCTGRSPRLRKRLGSTASNLCREPHRTLMLVRSTPRNPPLVILFQDPQQEEQALALAKRIRGDQGVAISLVKAAPASASKTGGKESREAPPIASLRSVLLHRGGIVVSRLPKELCEFAALELFLQETDAHVILLKKPH